MEGSRSVFSGRWGSAWEVGDGAGGTGFFVLVFAGAGEVIALCLGAAERLVRFVSRIAPLRVAATIFGTEGGKVKMMRNASDARRRSTRLSDPALGARLRNS